MEMNLFLDLSQLLALAAYLLGLSVFVQILQEIYKFLRSSKNAVYREVLRDTLGSVWGEVERSGLLADLQGRRPSQFLRRGPTGNLQPLDKEPLVGVLEQTAPVWVQRLITALRAEVADHQVEAAGKWSPDWTAFLKELTAVNEEETGSWTAADVKKFLAERGHLHETEGKGRYTAANKGKGRMAASLLLAQARRRFLPHVVKAEANYPIIQKNFEFAYRRQNLRLTFTLGFVVALLFNLPFEVLYRQASSLTPQQAVALAEQSTALYEKVAKATSAPSSSAQSELQDLNTSIQQLGQAVKVFAPSSPGGASVNYFIDWSRIKEIWKHGGVLRFLFGCLLTAALVSFGAPFWNDLLGRLMPGARSRAKQSPASQGE